MSNSEPAPLVSVGLPVRNGEQYLTEAIESILSQTYRSLELIICDNASTDGTEEICRRFEAADDRVRYFRNESNLGVPLNFNLAVERASGEYFRWSADDDLLQPEYLARCVEVLRRDPEVELCHSQVKVIDEEGSGIMDFDFPPGYAASASPSKRFGDVLCQDRLGFEIFGLMRTETLRRTRRLGHYVASDRTLRAELSLLGRYHILPQRLFLNRDHEGRSIRAYPAHHLRAGWYHPPLARRKVFPHWRVLYEYARAANRAERAGKQRVCCYAQIVRWLTRDLNWARLAADIVLAIFPGSWRRLANMADGYDRWLRRRA
jgi:glycosyltransferase involved in cell wall biosynthesis